MGMGYGANFVDEVETKFFVEHCKKEYEVLTNLLKEYELDWQEFETIVRDGFEQNGDAVFKSAYENLQEKCQKVTGLTPHIGYHSADDEGDRYDEINEVYWHMDGVWERTTAGKKYEEEVNRKFFVSFG